MHACGISTRAHVVVHGQLLVGLDVALHAQHDGHAVDGAAAACVHTRAPHRTAPGCLRARRIEAGACVRTRFVIVLRHPQRQHAAAQAGKHTCPLCGHLAPHDQASAADQVSSKAIAWPWWPPCIAWHCIAVLCSPTHAHVHRHQVGVAGVVDEARDVADVCGVDDPGRRVLRGAAARLHVVRVVQACRVRRGGEKGGGGGAQGSWLACTTELWYVCNSAPLPSS